VYRRRTNGQEGATEAPIVFGRVFECVESCLAELEPDPDAGFCLQMVEAVGQDADGLDWIAWDDLDGELSWAGDELRHIAPGSPV
jgi:hypothetical protein